MRIAGYGGRSVALGALLIASAGCGEKGRITFVIETPLEVAGKPFLSPFAGGRSDHMTVTDELSRSQLGSFLSTLPCPPEDEQCQANENAIGDIPVGHYDVRLDVVGRQLLLGMARTPSVDVVPLTAKTVTMSVRKPLAFYMSQKVYGDATVDPKLRKLQLPDIPLWALDPTLPSNGFLDAMDLPNCRDKEGMRNPFACPGATAPLDDGKLLLVATAGTAERARHRAALL